MRYVPTARKTPPGVIAGYWSATLALGLVVIGVVAALLTAVVRTARQIDAGAAEIWRVGKLIANNTVHIPLLVRTNQIAGGILAAADRTGEATARIERAVAGPKTGGTAS